RPVPARPTGLCVRSRNRQCGSVAARAEARNNLTVPTGDARFDLATIGRHVAAVFFPAMADVSIVVADVSRMGAIRDGAVLPGSMMLFAWRSLASAVESVRASRARVVGVDALSAQTPSGVSFLARLASMLPANAIRLIVQQPDGRWIAASRQEPPIVV